MSFVQRKISVAVRLDPASGTTQPGAFDESGTDTVTLAGHRTSVRIQNSGTPVGSEAQIAVYGLTLSLMDQLSTMGMVINVVTPRNTVTVTAGDDQSGLGTVFTGTIVESYPDFNASPDVSVRMMCNSGLGASVTPIPASSFTGAAAVTTIMQGFADKMGLKLENTGVGIQLSNPYFWGDVWSQVQSCARAANINAEIIDGQILAIWPKGKARTTPSRPVISKETGMIGYPAYSQQGIIIKSVFNPQFKFGGEIEVQTILKKASGIWAINKLDHSLDSQVPHGQWMSTIYAVNPNFAPPIPSGR